MATYQEQQWYANDPYMREHMELRRQHAKDRYDIMKLRIAELNAEFQFEEDPNSHVPEEYRNYLMRAFDQIFKDDPNAEANTQTWRKVMQAVITGDPRESQRALVLEHQKQQQQIKLQQMYSFPILPPINLPGKPFLISGVT